MLLLGRCGKRKGMFLLKLLIKALAAINDTGNSITYNGEKRPEH
jgi:hypothetical protein